MIKYWKSRFVQNNFARNQPILMMIMHSHYIIIILRIVV